MGDINDKEEKNPMDVNKIVSDAGITVGALTVTTVLRAALTLIVGAILVRVIMTLVDRALNKSERFAPLKVHVRPMVKFVLDVVLLLVVLDSLGVKVTSFIALLSVAGLAVSLALQNTLANIAGGIMIITAQPYSIGDYVSIDSTEGTVVRIGLSYCNFTTPDNKEVQIPNSQIAAARITNFNRLGRRRMDLEFTASYDAPTQEVYAALRDAMARFPQILQDPAPETHLKDYGASSISYIARLWVPAADYWTVYWGVIEAVRDTFAAHNVEMTYDHMNVHLDKI